jgi:uncharacterized protein (DUF342 family)
MADRLAFVIDNGTDTFFDGPAKIETVLPQPIRVKANQVIGYYLAEGENKPADVKSNLIWHLPLLANPSQLIIDGLKFTQDSPPKLIANKDGYLTTLEQQLRISKIYEIHHDVNAKTGNIKIDGSILIHGDVTQGIEIVVGGDAEVRGLVEDATIRANGSIVAKGGITGSNVGKLIASGNIYCQFVQQANIEAMGNLLVDGSIINSNVLCGKKIVIRKRGLLVGGKTMSRDGIEAAQVGTESAVPTEIEIGCNPFKRTHIERIENEINNLEQNMKTIMVQVKHIEHELEGFVWLNSRDLATSLFSTAEFLQNEGDQLGEDKISQTNKFGSGLMRLMRMTSEIEQLKEELKNASSKESFTKKAKLVVAKIAHPGVVVRIQDVSIKLAMEYDRGVFYYKPEANEVGFKYQ